jgi:hypothetical protein
LGADGSTAMNFTVEWSYAGGDREKEKRETTAGARF